MFKRLIICLFLFGAPLAVAAQTVQESIVSQLYAQGFSDISANRTWLGRVRIIAFRDDLRRELVFNPQTGEILRDYWKTLDEKERTPRLINPGSGAGASLEDGGNFYDDDDEADDDDEEDDDEEDDDEEDDDEEDDDEDDEEDD